MEQSVLGLVNANIGANMEPGERSNAANNQKIVSWSDMVQKNTQTEMPKSKPKVSWSYNEDGSINLIPPREYLIEARKQWNSSCIGHFIGGSFDFKFVRYQAFKIWKHRVLNRGFIALKDTLLLNSLR